MGIHGQRIASTGPSASNEHLSNRSESLKKQTASVLPHFGPTSNVVHMFLPPFSFDHGDTIWKAGVGSSPVGALSTIRTL